METAMAPCTDAGPHSMQLLTQLTDIHLQSPLLMSAYLRPAPEALHMNECANACIRA